MRKNLRRPPALVISLDKTARLFKLNAMKTKYLPVLVSLVLVFVVFLPQAEAVVPPPDGGYPGFTTAEGTNALKNLTTGLRIQQPVGIRSLRTAQAATTLA